MRATRNARLFLSHGRQAGWMRRNDSTEDRPTAGPIQWRDVAPPPLLHLRVANFVANFGYRARGRQYRSASHKHGKRGYSHGQKGVLGHHMWRWCLNRAVFGLGCTKLLVFQRGYSKARSDAGKGR
ncbi:MAG: hypothetical protein GY820_34360 [Gammaproteobacteria bacterium]|nr:hypothetical protein [Gammaproteobacteria bacterium]